MNNTAVSMNSIEELLNNAGDMLHNISNVHTEIMILLFKKMEISELECPVTVPFYSTSGFSTVSITCIMFEPERSRIFAATKDSSKIEFHELMPIIQNIIINRRSCITRKT